MRKILAQALASIAAEAAVNAIKELALGFATLFFNPAESAAHFTAAGLWASIGGVAALAGRAVAGDLFKQKDSNSGSGSGTRGATGQVNPVTLSRNAGTAPQISTQRIILEVQSNDSHIVKVVGANYNSGGKLRQIIINDGGVD
jgi:mevalonate pyrophosphate decarboxylase